MVTQKQLAKAINSQNIMIDIAKEKGYTCCKISDGITGELRQRLISYYTDMIGYEVTNDIIKFNHIKFMDDDNLFPSIVIKQNGTKDKTMFY